MTTARHSLRNIPATSRKFNLLIPLIICASGAMLAQQPELRLAVPLLVGVTALMAIMLAVTFFLAESGKICWSPRIILGVALLLRLMFLFSPPQLSDDIYRYLWDGSNLLRGTNPYAAAPSSVKPSPELSAIHSRINHPDYVTIYPPAAQLIFAGGAAAGGGITGLKALLLLLDLGLCALLLTMLRRLGMPAWRAVLYAWNPLPILEIAGSGHVDGAGMTMLLGACCLVLGERLRPSDSDSRRLPYLSAGALMASAGLVKLYPLILAPVLFLLVPAGRRRYFTAGFAAALAALLLPFLPYLVNIASSLDVYARNWEFAVFAFNTLRSLTGAGSTARLLLSAGFLLVVIAIVLRLAGSVDRGPSPVSRGRQALEACYAIAMAFLLLTPTLQPWYALSLAAFLPFSAGPAGIVLCWAVFLTYRVQIPYFILGQWIEDPYVTAVVFLAPVTAAVLARVFRAARLQKA